MKVLPPINWQMFKEQLLRHPDLDLQFQYAETQRVKPSYHITEIKQAVINSVDCGGVANDWIEIIVQLWEPSEKQQDRAMKVRKALSIIEIVEQKLPIVSTGIVKIEFGNSMFNTRQMFPGNIISDTDSLIIDLQPDFTECKAINRGGSCGPDNHAKECCSPTETKSGAEMVNFAVPSACCDPGSGCC